MTQSFGEMGRPWLTDFTFFLKFLLSHLDGNALGYPRNEKQPTQRVGGFLHPTKNFDTFRPNHNLVYPWAPRLPSGT